MFAPCINQGFHQVATLIGTFSCAVSSAIGLGSATAAAAAFGFSASAVFCAAATDVACASATPVVLLTLLLRVVILL